MLVTARLILNLRGVASTEPAVSTRESRMTGLKSILYEFELDARQTEYELSVFTMGRGG